MGRVINPQSAAKDRLQLSRSVILAVRELAQQQAIDQTTCDLTAFIIIALEQIYISVDVSVAAWEKRGYWLKADRFRMDWEWTKQFSDAMRADLAVENWAGVAKITGEVLARLSTVNVPKRHRLGTPWVGAYDLLKVNGK